MKTLKLVIFTLCTTLILAACGNGSSSESPELVVENMYKAYLTGNFKKAATYATKEAAIMFRKRASIADDELKEHKKIYEKARVVVLSSDINEKTGTGIVTVRLTNADGKTNTIKCNVIKEDGCWKADFSK